MEHLFPHLADALNADLPGSALAPHLQAFGGLPRQHRFGGGAALGVEIIGRQAPGGKARAAALFAAQKQAVGQLAAGQRRLQMLLHGLIAGQAVQHHSFSNRSTLVTNTVAPPTVTSMGYAVSTAMP